MNALKGLHGRLAKPKPSRDYGSRYTAASVMDHVTVVLGCYLAKAARPRARIVPQRVCAPRRQQETIAAGERKRIRYPRHAQPAISTRNHTEVREVGRRIFGGSRVMNYFFSGLRFTHKTPWRSGLQPGVYYAGHAHRLENI